MRPLRIAAVLTLVAALAASSLAAVVEHATVEQMTDLCTRCAVGVVRSKSVALDREKGVITTTWKLRVDESWLGDAAAELDVTVPGGSVPDGKGGTITQDFPGGAKLAEGRHVVLFLWKDGDGHLQVLGQSQGCFYVEHDAVTGDDVCENSVEGLTLIDHAGKKADAAPARLTLTSLRSRIDAARKAREAREQAARDALASKLAAMKKRADEMAAAARGRPGAPPE